MKSHDSTLRDPALLAAFDDAIAGQSPALFTRLRRASGLPGPHISTAIIEGFAKQVATYGDKADRLLDEMLRFDERVAPFGHVDEFLAICGVAGYAQRALEDANERDYLLAKLAESAIDERLRVRKQAAVGAAHVLVAEVAAGRAIVETLKAWVQSDEAWLGVLALETLSQPPLHAVVTTEVLHAILDTAFTRLASERRAGRRSEPWIRFSKALAALPVPWLSQRPSLALAIVPHAKVDDEAVRGAMQALAAALEKLGARVASEPLEKALEAHAKPLRNPKHERDAKKRKKLMEPH